MNREIKFRAWDKTRKEFLSGGEVLIAITKGSNPKSNPIYLDILKDPDFYKERFVLQQYIGLKDKNGIEIYEGDIVKHDFGFGDGKGIVYYSAPKFSLKEIGVKAVCDCFTWDEWESFEVIGNIYNNPELLQTR